MELKDRKRSFDINKLSISEAEALSTQIGDKVRNIVDEAAEKAKALLAVYGMSAKFSIIITDLDGKPLETSKRKPGRPRKQKQNNLNTQG